MYNLQSAKRLCLGRNLTGDSTCPSTRDGKIKKAVTPPLYTKKYVHGPVTLLKPFLILRARLYLVLGCDQLAACQRIDIDRFIFDTFVHRRSPVYTIGYLVVTRNQVFILYFIMAIPYSSPQATLPTDPAPCYLLRRSPTVCSSSVFRADPQPHE